jgi:hypothetical protein
VSQLSVARNNLMKSADSMDQPWGRPQCTLSPETYRSACTLLFAGFLLGFSVDNEDAGDIQSMLNKIFKIVLSWLFGASL